MYLPYAMANPEERSCLHHIINSSQSLPFSGTLRKRIRDQKIIIGLKYYKKGRLSQQ